MSSAVADFGLTIKDSDWNQPTDNQISVNFLDIRFWFDSSNSLQTNLYRKPTDSRVFLHYSSCHPNFTFSGIVYSQGLRLRRVINDDERLAEQLECLKSDFVKCKYPLKLIDDIFSKIKVMPRDLEKKQRDDGNGSDKILVISTHGRDKPLINVAKEIEKKSKNVSFKFVKKTAPSFRNILVKSKRASLGNPYGSTNRCESRNCMSCDLVSEKDYVVDSNQKIVKTAKGQCNSRCLIYHASCSFCNKKYVGKTVQPLNKRSMATVAIFIHVYLTGGTEEI